MAFIINVNKQFPTNVGIYCRRGNVLDKRRVRSEKTKAAIKQAFLVLFKTKEPEEITVVELCKKAGINRSTFYAHYEYIELLIEEVLKDSVHEMISGMDTQWELPLEDGGVSRNSIALYLDSFLRNSTLRRFCTCTNSNKYISSIIRAHVEYSLIPIEDTTRYYVSYFHYAGVMNFLLEWLNRWLPISKERVVEIIHEYSKNMYKSWD